MFSCETTSTLLGRPGAYATGLFGATSSRQRMSLMGRLRTFKYVIDLPGRSRCRPRHSRGMLLRSVASAANGVQADAGATASPLGGRRRRRLRAGNCVEGHAIRDLIDPSFDNAGWGHFSDLIGRSLANRLRIKQR